MVNIMGVDVLATQGGRASTIMILMMLNQNNSVPTRDGLMALSQYPLLNMIDRHYSQCGINMVVADGL